MNQPNEVKQFRTMSHRYEKQAIEQNESIPLIKVKEDSEPQTSSKTSCPSESLQANNTHEKSESQSTSKI